MVLRPLPHSASALLAAALVLAGCGGAAGDGGPRVRDDAQSISFAAAPALQVAGTVALSARASSDLAVSYSSQTPTVCGVDASSGVVSGLGIGNCVIAANQGGNDRFAPAPQALLTVAVSGRPQTLALEGPASVVVGDSAQLRAQASSGLPARFASQTPGTCSVDAETGTVVGVSSGACTVVATQPGDNQWAAAPQATQTLTIEARAQTLSATALPALLVGASTAAQASASSGLPVTWRSLSAEVCSISAAGLLSALSAGPCTVVAEQAGDAGWQAATPLQLATTVSRAAQAIAFVGTAPTLIVATSSTLRANASSGLAVAYASQTPSVCSIDASTGQLTPLAIGSCSVTARQAGNTSWAAATPASLTLAVAGMAQSLAFDSAPSLAFGGTAIVRATATSGLAVAYRSQTPAVCTVQAASGLVSSLAVGTCTIAANQPGDSRWAPAPQAVQTLGTGLAGQTLSFAAAPTLTVGGSASVNATASSGLAVNYGTLTPGVCSVSAAGTVSGLAIGSCSIAANQAGNTVWAAASQVSQTFTVSGKAQSISFSSPSALTAGGTATVRATATSGLAVSYASQTPATCSVNATSGLVSGLAAGGCTVAASQAGNSSWASAATVTQTLAVAANPNQVITFGAAPSLTLGGTATVRATASSGLAVSYSSLSAGICSVNASTGLVSAATLGDCIVAANQAGNASYNAAPQVTLPLPVQPPAGATVPGTPQGVTVSLGSGIANVVVNIASVASGGLGITGYTVTSRPAGITVQSNSSPITVNCPSSCAGYAFSVHASNALGAGSASAMTDVLTTFDVLTRFYEPDTQPRDSIFTGSFTLNSTTGAVSGLSGRLTESMTGNAIGSAPYYDMTQVSLVYQLQSWRDATLGGRFVASFAKNTTSTFSTSAGGDGWSPQAGVDIGGVYAGFPARYAGTIQNSSILIFVPDNPFAAPTTAQLAKLAYADCAPGGMMGAVCMTATSVAGYGAVGTMSGYPVSQQITKR